MVQNSLWSDQETGSRK